METADAEQDAPPPRRRAHSAEPRWQNAVGTDVEMDLQLERLGRSLERPRQNQSNLNTNEMSKLALSSQLALSSLASMGLTALQHRLEEAGTSGFVAAVQCTKVRNLGRVASSDSVSTMAPEESDGSEGTTPAGPEHRRVPRARPAARGRHEVSKAAGAKDNTVGWAYPMVSQMCADGSWVSPEHAWGAEWWRRSAPGKGCTWSVWSAEAACAWNASLAASW